MEHFHFPRPLKLSTFLKPRLPLARRLLAVLAALGALVVVMSASGAVSPDLLAALNSVKSAGNGSFDDRQKAYDQALYDEIVRLEARVAELEGSPSPSPPPPPAPSDLGSKLPARMADSSGGSLYVSLSGSDSNSCTQAAPCRNLDKALSAAANGTTVYVRGGTYTDSPQIYNRRFSQANPVTITSYPGENAKFTGNGSQVNMFYLFNVNGLRIRSLEMSQSKGYPATAIKVDNSSHLDLDKLYIHNNNGQGIFVAGNSGTSAAQSYSSDVQVWDSRFANNGGYAPDGAPHAIYYGGGQSPDGTRMGTLGGVIGNNVIYDEVDGSLIQLYHEADGVIVTNNTLYHSTVVSSNKGQGMNIGNAGTDGLQTKNAIVVNNIITHNASAGIQSSCWATDKSSLVDYNMLYANPLGDLLDECSFTNGGHNLHADPLYVNAGARDLHLRAASPARGEANPDYAPPYDIEGNARPASPALGAYA